MKTGNIRNSLGKRTYLTRKIENLYAKSASETTKNQKYRVPIPWILFLLVSLLSFETTNADWLMECGSCHCKWNSGKKTADCKNLSLFSVPNNLSPEVQVLDLSHNEIPVLEENIFLDASLQNLHKLYIRNSSLQRVDPRTFVDLKILIEVDLSNNLLRSLQINQFYHLVKVRAILLNNNLLEMLSDGVFQTLTYLHRIELRGNRLVYVGTQVFMNLPMLSQIYLDENRLNFLRKESFENLKRLTALSLDHNPWNCTCDLQMFRDFVLQRNLYTPPTACYYPAHLRGTLWIEDHNEAFVCKPKILYPARGASINTVKENTTLICRVHASPNTQIVWNHNRQNLRPNTALNGHRIQIHLTYDERSKPKKFERNMLISRLTIFGVDKSDEGIYTCLAENPGGKDSVQMTLLVQSSDSKDLWLLQENFIVLLSVTALGLLSIIIFLAMAACCLYKHFKFYKDITYRQRHLDQFAHLDTELNAASDVVVESSIIDSGMIVCSSNTVNGNNDDSKITSTTVSFQNLHNHPRNDETEKNVKIYASGLHEDGSYLIANTRKEKSMISSHQHSRENTNDLVPNNNTSNSQRPKWPPKNNNTSKIIKENTDAQRERGIADFQPDLLSAYNKDVNS